MGEFDFTYRLPQNFSRRVVQYLEQLESPNVARAFQNCTYDYEDLGLAYYAGMKGDNWDKKALDFTVEGSPRDIALLKSKGHILKESISKSLKSSESGFLLKEIYYFESESVEPIPLSNAARLNADIASSQVVLRDLLQIGQRFCLNCSFNGASSENSMNDYFRDLLFMKGYTEIKDQTRHGLSVNKKDSAEVDILLTKDGKEIAIYEGLKLSSVSTTYIDTHISKAVVNYNALGTSTFIVAYVDDRKNGRLFEQDSSYYLLCSLENLDEQGQLKSKAAMFTKRTIRPECTVTNVDTPTEALAVSIGERGRVDLPYMAELLGTPGDYERITSELSGVIFKDPGADPTDPEAGWRMADEYLSGNVRAKLRMAQLAAETNPEFAVNVTALEKAQPKDLEASEIDVRLGATWLAPEIIQKFMAETFQIPYYLRHAVKVRYSPYTAEWRIEGKSAMGRGDIISSETYGTSRANAYKILEDTLNLKDVRIYDAIEDEEGKLKRILNKTDTMLAQQKQQVIKDAFANWIWKDPQRRIALVKQYNELFNSSRPREYDGSHIHLVGMNPEITLREHQRNAIAHVLYGGNTLLAHEVGAGKTFEMAASAMEAKRLGLCQKSLFVVPNHLTEQWASEFLHLYPNAKLLVARKKDFETANRKKFCARIATGDYDAVIIGHSQFERIPLSYERQERIIQEQIDETLAAIEELKANAGENFSIKQMEKTRKTLETKLEKLRSDERKDDVITFEQLGVDRLFVDESHFYKNRAKRCA